MKRIEKFNASVICNEQLYTILGGEEDKVLTVATQNTQTVVDIIR